MPACLSLQPFFPEHGILVFASPFAFEENILDKMSLFSKASAFQQLDGGGILGIDCFGDPVEVFAAEEEVENTEKGFLCIAFLLLCRGNAHTDFSEPWIMSVQFDCTIADKPAGSLVFYAELHPFAGCAKFLFCMFQDEVTCLVDSENIKALVFGYFGVGAVAVKVVQVGELEVSYEEAVCFDEWPGHFLWLWELVRKCTVFFTKIFEIEGEPWVVHRC